MHQNAASRLSLACLFGLVAIIGSGPSYPSDIDDMKAAVAATPRASAVLPRSGATSYVAEAVGRVIDVAELGRGETETLVEVTGVTRNTLGQSAFDKMTMHCLISFTTGGGRSSAVGACSETDRDGDTLFTSFDDEAGKLRGGTGKYAGMTGSAVFSVKPEPSSEASKIVYSVNHDVTWAQK
jgi:hypothetical protein